MIRLELWNGARGENEKRALREFEGVLPDLEVGPEVWEVASDLARRARAAGLTVPAADLLIVACARHHGVEIESLDAHFAELEKLGSRRTSSQDSRETMRRRPVFAGRDRLGERSLSGSAGREGR